MKWRMSTALLIACLFLTSGCKEDIQEVDLVLKAGLTIKRAQSFDGSWGNARTTSCAIIAYLSSDEIRNASEFRQSMMSAADWLLGCIDGEIVDKYDFPIITCALIKLYELLPNPNIKFAAQTCLSAVIESQREDGLWSTAQQSAWAVMALYGARLAGLQVPDDVKCLGKVPAGNVSANERDGVFVAYIRMVLKHGDEDVFENTMRAVDGLKPGRGTDDPDYFASEILRMLANVPSKDLDKARMRLELHRQWVASVRCELAKILCTASSGSCSAEGIERLSMLLMQADWASVRSPAIFVRNRTPDNDEDSCVLTNVGSTK